MSLSTSTPPQWPGVGGTSIYSEKLQVGYRWFDAHHVEPLFPFGFGLSYTTFHLSHLTASPTVLNTTGGQLRQEIRLQVSITNTGHRAGAEVVQAYVQQPVKNGEPPRQLRAFAKIVLNPGETKSASLVLAPRSFSIYDTANHRWTFPPGIYHILVGDSSRHLPLHAEVRLAANTSSPMQAP